MKPSSILLLATSCVFLFIAESSPLPSPFVAVFIESDDGTNTTSGTNLTSNSAYNQVFQKVQNSTVAKVNSVLNGLNVTSKVDTIINKLGGNGTDEATKFQNIISHLENSSLSSNAISTVENILTKLENGDGFAVLSA